MKQLLILSGKGGTGKTTVASAFIHLAEAKTYADCDVDAPNLHLITGEKEAPLKEDFFALPLASIDPDLCIACGICYEHCRFNSILPGEVYTVDPFACEGCGVCAFVCPVEAVTMVPDAAGQLMLYKEEDRVFSTAQLKMGKGTSGLLVAEVKKRMREEAVEKEFAIIDGSPGIGCPVIASLSGVDMVLIVAEPSISGMSDMERVIDTAMKFGVKIAVCVNKYDVNRETTEKIEDFCRKQNLHFVGLIPFDKEAVRSINEGKTIVETDCPSGQAVKAIYEKTMDLLLEKED